jgi:hypothetical protein
MLAQYVEVARPDVWLVREWRHLVGVDEARPQIVEPVLAREII